MDSLKYALQGERIKAMRERAGLNQTDFAEMFGVSQQAIGTWEKGKSTPKVHSLASMCQRFDVSMDHLVFGSPLDGVEPADIDDEEEVGMSPANFAFLAGQIMGQISTLRAEVQRQPDILEGLMPVYRKQIQALLELGW